MVIRFRRAESKVRFKVQQELKQSHALSKTRTHSLIVTNKGSMNESHEKGEASSERKRESGRRGSGFSRKDRVESQMIGRLGGG